MTEPTFSERFDALSAEEMDACALACVCRVVSLGGEDPRDHGLRATQGQIAALLGAGVVERRSDNGLYATEFGVYAISAVDAMLMTIAAANKSGEAMQNVS